MWNSVDSLLIVGSLNCGEIGILSPKFPKFGGIRFGTWKAEAFRYIVYGFPGQAAYDLR